ncbi:MAG: hypothetical protein Q4F28_15165 [Eubacteriales bacterium]|nr:hypothetical protein [Eubacteriales bacterium]
MESRKKSYRRNPYRIMRQRLSALMAFVLTVCIVLGNGGFNPYIALASQSHEKQEFRLHAEDIRQAAIEALEAGDALDEPLEIGGDSETLVERYQEFLEPDGTLYEISPDYVTTSNIEEMELRIFLRADKAADDGEYQLTGEEELIFLYVNSGKEPVDVRLNIDGYVTEFNTVNAYQTAFAEPEEDKATDSNASQIPAEPEVPAEEPKEPAEDVKEPETSTPPVITVPEESETPAEESKESQAPSEEPKEPETPAEESKEPQAPENQETPAAGDEPEENLDDTIEIELPQSESLQEEVPVQASEVVVGVSDADQMRVGMSHNRVYTVASALASPSNAEDTDDTVNDTDDETDEEETLDEIELINDLVDPLFEKVGRLKGKPYNLVSLDDCMTARAFLTSMNEIEKCEPGDMLEDGMHAIEYVITTAEGAELGDTEATAELVHAPETVADGTQVIFGIIPQEGYEIAQVTANGEELAQADEEELAGQIQDETATPSDAELNVEGAVYYSIPEVLEEQWVEIELAKVVPVEVFEAGTLTADVAEAGYSVEVSYGADAEIPEGAKLVVKPVDEAALDYIHYDLLKLDEVRKDGETFALDIKIVADGQEIQPAVPVKVTIANGEVPETAEVAVYHLPGTDAEMMEEAAEMADQISTFSLDEAEEDSVGEKLKVKKEKDKISFVTDGFSTFYIEPLSETPAVRAPIEQNKTYIRIAKTFTGISTDQIPSDYRIIVTDTIDSSKKYTLIGENQENIIFDEEVNADTGAITWTWDIIGAPDGEYSIFEENYKVEGMDVFTTGFGKNVTVISPKMDPQIAEKEPSCSSTVFDVGEGTFFAARMNTTKGHVAVIITSVALTAAQENEIKAKIKGEWSLTNKRDPFEFYVLKPEQDTQTFEFLNVTLTYNKVDDNNSTVRIGATKEWTQALKFTYNYDSGQNPSATTTNTYTPMPELTIGKKVDGNMGNQTKPFDFKIQVFGVEYVDEDGDGIVSEADRRETDITSTLEGDYLLIDGLNKIHINNDGSFQLKHSQTFIIPQGIIPTGSKIVVWENPDGYEPIVKVMGDTNEKQVVTIAVDDKGNHTGSVGIRDLYEDTVVEFTNTKNGIPDTGILLDSLPYFLILAGAVGGIAVYVIRKRKKEESDLD